MLIENKENIPTKHNWSLKEIAEIYHQPLLELVYQAACLHKKSSGFGEVQISSLVSIKTGGCPEDCGYCPQAARYHTEVETKALMGLDELLSLAESAKKAGASRLCMGAAWREVRDNRDFDRVLDMVEEVNKLGMEVCCTLGMLTEHQAQRLSDAGVYAYNHNIDTSPEDYERIIHTRTFEDRLRTLENVRKTKMTVCSGGIIGMGETVEDRIAMLQTLANLEVHPESVPLNALVKVKGTPLANEKALKPFEMVRMVATARILMPSSVVRLSAGRLEMSETDQAFCFMAGANSIFIGEKLLTTSNPELEKDLALLAELGLKPRMPFKGILKEEHTGLTT